MKKGTNKKKKKKKTKKKRMQFKFTTVAWYGPFYFFLLLFDMQLTFESKYSYCAHQLLEY